MFVSTYLVLSVWSLVAESTDIAAVYKDGIILLRDADMEESPAQNADDVTLQLPKKFTYPVALTHEPLRGTLYVADINNADTDIFAINFRNKTAVSVEALVSKLGSSTIESLTYDPMNHQILWADSHKDGLYAADIPDQERKISASKLVINTGVYNPRGIAIDYCKRDLYWTERYRNERSIEKVNLDSKSIAIVARADNNTYYQAVDYNSFTRELIWAETSGDEESNSTCRIMIQPPSGDPPIVLASVPFCYPFSIASDEHFIYWSDWSRNGIMRLSRENPESLVKLVHTPRVKTDAGDHNGAFGIVTFNELKSQEKNPCLRYLDNSEEKAGPGSQETSQHSRLTFPLRRNGMIFQQNLIEYKDKLAEEKTDAVVRVSARSSASALNSSSPCKQLPLVIIGFSLTCLFFMTTTILLVIRSIDSRQIKRNALKQFFVTIPTSTTNPVATKKPRSHRRFGPAKRKSLTGPVCPLSVLDGVRIDIEDCCQMTQCDMPCFTSMKREGKGYSITETFRSSVAAEDKKCLLTDDFDVA